MSNYYEYEMGRRRDERHALGNSLFGIGSLAELAVAQMAELIVRNQWSLSRADIFHSMSFSAALDTFIDVL